MGQSSTCALTILNTLHVKGREEMVTCANISWVYLTTVRFLTSFSPQGTILSIIIYTVIIPLNASHKCLAESLHGSENVLICDLAFQITVIQSLLAFLSLLLSAWSWPVTDSIISSCDISYLSPLLWYFMMLWEIIYGKRI